MGRLGYPGGTRSHLARYRRDSYITGSPSAQQPEPACTVIDCSLGYNPLGSSKRAEEAIRGANFAQMAAYPEPFYDELLKPVILNKFAGAGLREQNIFFGPGSFNIAERLIHKLIDPTCMLGYGPQFNEIPSEMVAAGGRYDAVPMTTDFRFPKDAIIQRLEEDVFSVVYIDNPNNPTGQFIELADLADVVEVAERRGVIAFVDEAYGDFVEDSSSCFNIVGRFSNLVVTRSMSKGLGLAALRVGYAAMSDALAQVYRKIDIPFEPDWLGALAAKATLEDTEFIKRTRQAIGSMKTVLISGLQRTEAWVLPTHPQVSILVAHAPGRNLFQALVAQGVLTEAGSLYRNTFAPFDDSFVRIRVPGTMAMAYEVVERVRRAL